jgi:hypothetical protein
MQGAEFARRPAVKRGHRYPCAVFPRALRFVLHEQITLNRGAEKAGFLPREDPLPLVGRIVAR